MIWVFQVLFLKQSQFPQCCLGNSLSFPTVAFEIMFSQCYFETIWIYTVLCLKQSVYTIFWNNLATASVCFWKKSEFPQYCLWNTFSFLIQCCLETVLIAHCCFWNRISFLNFVFETVSVSLMFSLKQSCFPSTLKQSQFVPLPQYCLWSSLNFRSTVFETKLISPLLSFETVSSFPDSLNFPSFVFGTVSGVLKRLSSVCIVVLKQFYFP